MATTSIWKIEKRLDHVITYTTNPDKTSKESYSELHNVIEYATASYKTEEQLYVTSLNCSKETIYQDMMRTKRRYSKTNKILGYHAFQSFAEGETTPEQAHEIGIKLAEELWGDRFEVVVSTHINTKHIHNHFCINSVSFKDGKKYYNNRHTYALLRKTSDRLCKEYNLSVLEEKPCGKYNIDYTKYYNEEINKLNYYNEVREDIDYAIEQAYSYNDFLSIMKNMDYVIETRAGKLSIRKSNRKRNIRIERDFGENYKIDNIKERIFNTEAIRVPFPEIKVVSRKYSYNSRNKTRLKNRKKVKGIRALYLHYCYLLKIYPNKKQRISKALREDIKKMDKISKEVRFLSRTGIQTDQELFLYESKSIIKRKELKSKKEYLWRKLKRVSTEDEKQEIKNKINELNKEIKKISEELELIEDIKTRIPIMKENIKEEQNKNKSRNKNLEEKEKNK